MRVSFEIEITLISISFLIESITRLSNSETIPVITNVSGFNNATAGAIVLPTLFPIIEKTSFAIGSPFFAASIRISISIESREDEYSLRTSLSTNLLRIFHYVIIVFCNFILGGDTV